MSVAPSLHSKLIHLMNDVSIQTVQHCANRYGFDYHEALSILGLSSQKKYIPLPFAGNVFSNCCQGIKPNHGLYTQCMKPPISGPYCSSCKRQADANSSGKPNAGNIHDRMDAFTNGTTFRDPKGNTPVHFALIISKMNLSRNDVIQHAQSLGIQLDDFHFVPIDKKRGRPRKNPVDETPLKSPRGRPRKTPKPVIVSSTEDLFASLISNARLQLPQNQQSDNSKPYQSHEDPHSQSEHEDSDSQSEHEDSDSDNDEQPPTLSVKRFEFNGFKYLRAADDTLFDPITQLPIAKFLPYSNTLLFI
jgi:hypothetical protein